jgi:hypothetical protein
MSDSERETEIKIHIKKKKKIADYLSASSLQQWETQLNKYYQLKQAYESQALRLMQLQLQQQQQPQQPQILPNRYEEDKNARMFTPLCIQCQRPVGTIFGRKYNEKKKCALVFAQCGDRKHPCSLKILIYTGKFVHIATALEYLQVQIADQKKRIIEWKNNVLFGYESEETVLDRFESSKKEIAELNLTVNRYYSQLYAIHDTNREWRKKLSLLQETIHAIVFDIEQLKVTDKDKWFKLADAYQRLDPLFQQLRELKYSVCFVQTENKVEDGELEPAFQLIQSKNAIAQYLVEEIAPLVQVFHYYPKESQKKKYLQQQQHYQEQKIKLLQTPGSTHSSSSFSVNIANFNAT